MHKPHLIRFVMVNGRELTISVEPEVRRGVDAADVSGRETLSPIESVRRAFADRGVYPYFTDYGRPGFVALANVCWFEDLGEVEE